MSSEHYVTSYTQAEPEAHYQFGLSLQGDNDRQLLETLIYHNFMQYHQARIFRFMPVMIAAWKNDQPVAVAGLDMACGFAEERSGLFTETYLDIPAEQAIAREAARPVSRNQVIEIGNLASGNKEACRLLFVMLAELLYLAGFRWVICTVTPVVERQLRMMKFEPMLLGYADGSRLGEQQQNWGNYYDSSPRIIAGSLGSASQHVHSSPVFSNSLLGYQQELNRMVLQLNGGQNNE
ncbi:thermostable hemolysin [Endozoicomonadaceae bacterium StTr2]